jgi:hypothetical protein
VKARKQNSKQKDNPKGCMAAASVSPDRASANKIGDPFATFSEWSSEADEKAYRDL